jgi:hypothetical protein
MEKHDSLSALEAIHAKRGYLLPHHGLMAISTPHLLERYDSLYSTLALRGATSQPPRSRVCLAGCVDQLRGVLG